MRCIWVRPSSCFFFMSLIMVSRLSSFAWRSFSCRMFILFSWFYILTFIWISWLFISLIASRTHPMLSAITLGILNQSFGSCGHTNNGISISPSFCISRSRVTFGQRFAEYEPDSIFLDLTLLLARMFTLGSFTFSTSFPSAFSTTSV